MNNLIANVNLNSQDVEEGQLPDDGYQQPRSFKPLQIHSQAEAQNSRHIDMSDLQPEYSSSEEIVLEVVQDQFYNDNKNKKIKKQNLPTKSYQHSYNKQKDKNIMEKQQKERKIQKNDKKPINNFAPEKEEINVNPNNNKNQGYPPASYYPPYMYPPHPMHMQMGQYPPMYQPYPYPMPYMHPNQNHYNPNMPMPPYQPNNNHPQPAQNNIQTNNQYRQYMPQPHPSPPPQQYPEYMTERINQNPYKMPPNPMNMYPYHHGYPGYPPMPYPPYDYYNRQRQAQHRQQQIRINRKKEYIQQLRNQLKRNVKQFNGQESYEIVQTVKCILKFQDAKPYNSNSHSNNTETPLNQNDSIKQSISQRCYERSLSKIQKWLQGDNPNVRQFTKGLLEAMQMSDVILKIKELKLNRKMQQQSLQSETKRLLDVLVRDPKKMIF